MSLKYIAAFVVTVSVVGAVAFYFYTNTNQLPSPATNAELAQETNGGKLSGLAMVSEQQTIANTWQWDVQQESYSDHNNVSSSSIDARSNLPFTTQSVYDALQAVKLDGDGNVVLDHDALISLDEALERIYNRLDDDSLNILQNLIRQHLPGNAGEQTAQIVGNYKNFLLAKDEFSEFYESAHPVVDVPTLESLNSDQLLYGELQSLRETYLGKDTSDQLFRISDANATYMFASLALDIDQTLSPEEKRQQREILEANHIEQSVNITDWPSRYADFLVSRDIISNAAISDEEKRAQISTLYEQRFNEEERDRIGYLQIEQF